MIPLTYRARALGPLRVVDWAIPQGVSVVVGPNRVGKSTLLRLPELIKIAIEDGLNEAIKVVFDGVSYLRNFSVPASAPISIGFGGNDVEWTAELAIRGAEVAAFPSESLSQAGKAIISRAFGSDEIEADGDLFPMGSGLIPKLSLHFFAWLTTSVGDSPETRSVVPVAKPYAPVMPEPVAEQAVKAVVPVATAISVRSYRSYHYEISHLLRFGSHHSSALTLLATGENVFPLLRNWRDRPDLEERYEFVLSTMREIFPHLGRVGFEQAGQTVTMTVNDRRWPEGKYIPIARESTGFITALLNLCAIASADRNSLVTLDEIETSLHPRAIRVLIEAMRRRAASHDLRIVLATQSETVLDQFRDDPSHVFVLEPKQERSPQALTELFSPEYLSQFSLGDLFAHLEYGSDEPADP
jgi:hypothetical protein